MKSFVSGLLCLAMLVLAGCTPAGPAVATTGGTVTLDGKGIGGVTVTFNYSDNTMASGVTDEGGKFKLQYAGKDGAPPGKAKVTFSKAGSTLSGMPANPKPEDMMKAMASKGKDAKAEKKDGELPAKYAKPEESGKTADVVAGKDNDFTFDLTSK